MNESRIYNRRVQNHISPTVNKWKKYKGRAGKKINMVANEHGKGWLSLAWTFVSSEGSTIDSFAIKRHAKR